MKRIILLLVMVHSVHAGPVLDMLKSKKSELEVQKNNIINNKKQLVDVYGQLTNDLIKKINDVISQQLDVFLGSIDAAQNAVKSQSQDILNIAGIGDVGGALSSIKTVIDTTRTILVGVRDRFSPIISSLAPSTDPKGIYAGLDSAVVNMNKAEDEIVNFQGLAQALDI